MALRELLKADFIWDPRIWFMYIMLVFIQVFLEAGLKLHKAWSKRTGRK